MSTTCKVLFGALIMGASLVAQQAPVVQPPGQTLTAQQLNDLVAPIALYPDPLVSQILVASTYPLELVEAGQWLERNPGLSGTALVQAAEDQDWDPSVQALVVFPDLMKRLNQDIAWTNNLGNAFLNQQADVMDAVQQMRLSAQQAGKLASNQQQTVTTTYDSGPPVVTIQPASPQVIYVPYYNPVNIWGPSYYYPYANWYYPPYYGGPYFSWGIGINIGGYFGAGWGGWGGWGWSPYWGNRTIIVNNTFIRRNNFNGRYGGGGNGAGVWAHNAAHRGGVRYTSASVNNQFGGAARVSRSFAGRSTQSFSPRAGGQSNLRSSAGSFAASGSTGRSTVNTRQFAPRSTNVNRGSVGGGTQVAGGNVNRAVGSVNRGNGSFAPRSVSGGNTSGFSSPSVSRGSGGNVMRNSPAVSGGGVSRGNGGGFSAPSVSRGASAGGSIRSSGGFGGGGGSRASSGGGGGVSRGGGGGGGGNRGGGGGRR